MEVATSAVVANFGSWPNVVIPAFSIVGPWFQWGQCKSLLCLLGPLFIFMTQVPVKDICMITLNALHINVISAHGYYIWDVERSHNVCRIISNNAK